VGTLGVAAVADFAVAALAPVSAGILVATNLKTLRDAAGELLRLRPGCATLYATILGGTLVSGFYFSAALMAWLMNFWDRRYHRRLADAQRELLFPLRRQSRFAWLCREGTEVEIPLDQVRTGDILAVRTGELIPADGVVVSGAGKSDGNNVVDADGLTIKAVGDRVFATTRLIEGELRFRVSQLGDSTLAKMIGVNIERAIAVNPQPLKVRGEPFARFTVPPTLATAGIGFLTGDVTTALAILRADYASGPGMIVPLGLLEDIGQCLREGIVVSNAQIFAELKEITTLLIDQDSFDVRTGSLDAAAVARMRATTRLQIGLLSGGGQGNAHESARQLGLDFAFGGLSPEKKADLIQSCIDAGERVAFLGDCQRQSAAAKRAQVAISLGKEFVSESIQADAHLLGSELSRVSLLWEIATRQQRRQWTHSACAVIPNLLCVAGAFALGFTGLHTVLLTNLGTFTVYRSASRWLRDHARGRQGSIGAEGTECAYDRVTRGDKAAPSGVRVGEFARSQVT